MRLVSHPLCQEVHQIQLLPRPVIVFLSADQVMESLTIGRSKLYESIREGMLPQGINVLGRSVRWIQDEIDAIKRHVAVSEAREGLINLVGSFQLSRCAPVAPTRQLALRGPSPHNTAHTDVQPLTFLTEEQVREEFCLGRTKFYEAIGRQLVPPGLKVLGRSKRWVAAEVEWTKRLLVLGATDTQLQLTSKWMALWR